LDSDDKQGLRRGLDVLPLALEDGLGLEGGMVGFK
jgi:hypothetical protein